MTQCYIKTTSFKVPPCVFSAYLSYDVALEEAMRAQRVSTRVRPRFL